MEPPVSKKRKTDCYISEDLSTNGNHGLTEEMNSSEDSSTDGINRLPVEILIKITADLPLRDRKNTRSVCRHWFSVNNVRKISRKEKFLCDGVYGVDSVLQTLQNSKKDVLNLQFIHSDFSIDTDLSLEFWTKNGWKIESLSFTHCTLSEKTLEQIIINCDKMRYFAIKNPLPKFRPCKKGRKLMSGPTLKKLINIRREKLHSFHLEAFIDTYMSNEFLRVMFVIYPNIDDFSFVCPYFIEDEDLTVMADVDLLRSDRILTFGSILKKLVDSRKIMRSINLDAAQNELHSKYMLYNFLRLTSIENVCLESRPEHPIFDFLSRHIYLTFIDFRLWIKGNSEDCLFLERLMNCTLDLCTHLDSLKIDISENVFLTDDRIFGKIKNSNLKSLDQNFNLNVSDSDTDANGIINKTLKYLHLPYPEGIVGTYHQMVHAFVKTFRGLSELIIDDGSCISNSLLQDLFLYQRQLTSLKLRALRLVNEEGSNLTEYGFTGIDLNGQRTGYSIKDLNKLECLALSRWDHNVTKEFLEELRFPNLTTLFLEVHDPKELIRSEELVRTFSGLPNLETVVFKGPMYYPTWLKICRQLKRLRFLYIESAFKPLHKRRFCDRDFKRFFENCPTLRVLHRCKALLIESDDGVNDNDLGDGEPKIYSYHLDTVKNVATEVKQRKERLFPPDVFDTYWVPTYIL